MPAGQPRIDSLPVHMLRWWARLRLPRTPRLLQSAGVWDQRLWGAEPSAAGGDRASAGGHPSALRTCRGRWHGYRLSLDTSDYHQRGMYFYGRLLDVPVQLCMLAALGRGDTCIDVGANIGMLSMLAAYAVGRRGRVEAFEPNPEVYRRLKWHLAENRLAQVRAHQLALSDRDATMRLSVPPTGNTGAATLGALPARHGNRVGAAFDVAVRTGDGLLGDLPVAPTLIKLDVEGHEPAALRGLARIIQSRRPAIIAESNTEMLPACGTSVGELFELLTGRGYEPYAMSVVWRKYAREWRLRLHPMPASWRPVRTQNVLFLVGEGIHRRRLGRFVHGAASRS